MVYYRVLLRRSAKFIHDFLPVRFKYASVVVRVELCKENIFYFLGNHALSPGENSKTDFFAEGSFAVLILIFYSDAIKILITPLNTAQKVVSVHQFSQLYLKVSQS